MKTLYQYRNKIKKMKYKASHHPKHNNQVRIIGGTCRGRKINFPLEEGLRPTPDSVRERLFNWLGQDLTGKKVLDLFGGSGALGLEAASRYAANVSIIENNHKTVMTLKNSVQQLQLHQISIIHSDGLDFLDSNPNEMFDVVFLDPPFIWANWGILFDKLKGHLNDMAFIYIEARQLPKPPEWLNSFRSGRAGESRFELRVYQQ